ncbi:complex I subunit 4 family protein [Methylomagnum ishizawai]|uniref:complex I subunit 4 family protein n=1 Tax=Methylomagnum ishizawai TaxID=1760988 RepID=UPI001C331BCC|nr:NADH-quinone oxidoreductase subunit M [Methylomagnum ishizawai]BBL74621.1 NADH-quinone oxidoreductase subunit M [Methylomagnum ishizawai]
MMLVWLVGILVAGGGVCWAAERAHPAAPRWLALLSLALAGAWLVPYFTAPGAAADGVWLDRIRLAWIPRFGIGFHLGLDGVSLLLAALTVLLGLMAVAVSWREIEARTGPFHACLLWTLAGALGVFLALDLFLFFVCWELMILPMYAIIAVWGHENRGYAALKFLLFTQVSGLSMLLAAVVLALSHQAKTGQFSFDYFALLGTELDPATARWLMLGFFVAFAVKLPTVPLHTWLPDAHTQAPTGGSVILAGVLLKTGAYGLLRFAIPLFPGATAEFAPTAMGLGVVGIIYGGMLAFAQTDMKRLVAYSSISHMGFVLVGLYAQTGLGFQGAVLTMLAHGLSAAALFMLAGALQNRLHTRDMNRMGGLWGVVPRMAAIGLFFSVAALGMPGLGNFVGEFLVLAGAFQLHQGTATLAALGLVIGPAYALILVQRAFHGPRPEAQGIEDCGPRETAALAVLIAATLAMGLYPQPLIDIIHATPHPVVRPSLAHRSPP